MVKEAEAPPSKEEIERLKAEIEKEKREKAELQEWLNKMQSKIEGAIKALEEVLNQLKA